MSNALVNSLKEGHSAIVDTLDQVQMVARSYVEAKPRIREMDARLLVHYRRQNDDFFEQLRDFYHENRKATKMIEFLIHDLKDFKVKHFAFFEKHSGEALDMSARTFPKDFDDFSQDVIVRLKIEEDYLFPLVERLPT